MKVKKENKRFNAETVVANYRFGTWNIGTLKGKSGEVADRGRPGGGMMR